MFVCSNCTAQSSKWQGKCLNCNNWNTLEESVAVKKKTGTKASGTIKRPVFLKEVSLPESKQLLSKISEWDNVLGNGITPGSMIILTGDPGVGKSTLMIQVADKLTKQNHKVIYFSSEESLQQLKNKLENLSLIDTKVLFCDESNVSNIIQILKEEKPATAIIDSLQNCRLDPEGTHNFSAIAAIKETAHQLMVVAKEENIALIITGHITKEGVLAGPKLLEHLVDAVFYLQNDSDSHKKILSSVKNRFGAIDEVGFFELGESGFTEVLNVNQSLLEESSQKNSLGSILFLSFKGSRCLLSEFQALCLKNHGTIPQRIIAGVDAKKVLIIAALLEKYLKIDLSSQDIFFKIKGGLKISENYSDLAIALSMLSSYLKQPLPSKIIAVGEINLNGRISRPINIEKIIKAGKKQGLCRVITGGGKEAIDQSLENIVTEIPHIYSLMELFGKT